MQASSWGCSDGSLSCLWLLQAKAQIWQEQVEVLTGALQQANAEKAVIASDKARLEQEVASLRLQMGVMAKALEMAQGGGAANGAAKAPGTQVQHSLILVP